VSRPISLSPKAFEQASEEYNTASHGGKRAVLERWAERAGCSPDSLRQAIIRGWITRPKRLEYTKQERTSLDAAAAFAEWAVTSNPSTYISPGTVIPILEAAGRIPKGLISPRKLCRYMREHRIGSQYRVVRRFRRTEPNAMHQVDFSVSRVLKSAGDGSVQVRSNFIYENRPDEDRLRVWLGSAWDSASKIFYAQYFLSKGESTRLALDFIQRAWRPKQEFPLCGVPRMAYVDPASWTKTAEIQNLADKLGMDFRRTKPRSPWSKGGVERNFKSIKEALEALVIGRLARGTSISLAWVNSILMEYCKQMSVRPHPEGGTRLEYYKKNVSGVWFPENFNDLAFKQIRGTVRRGLITYKKKDYYAPAVVLEGQRVELIELDSRLYLFIPRTTQAPARRILLEEAKENSIPPVHLESREAQERVADMASKVEPFRMDDVEKIVSGSIPENTDFSPPAVSNREAEGPGVELLHETAQREVLADLVGNLGDLPAGIRQKYVDNFCCVPHSRGQLTEQAMRIRAATERQTTRRVNVEKFLGRTNGEKETG